MVAGKFVKMTANQARRYQELKREEKTGQLAKSQSHLLFSSAPSQFPSSFTGTPPGEGER